MSTSLLRPGSHQGHRAIRRPLNPAQGFKSWRFGLRKIGLSRKKKKIPSSFNQSSYSRACTCNQFHAEQRLVGSLVSAYPPSGIRAQVNRPQETSVNSSGIAVGLWLPSEGHVPSWGGEIGTPLRHRDSSETCDSLGGISIAIRYLSPRRSLPT